MYFITNDESQEYNKTKYKVLLCVFVKTNNYRNTLNSTNTLS